MDLGHKQTDDMLKNMEGRIQKVYAQAARETEQKVVQYYSSYADKYAKKVAELNAGNITKADFQAWCRNQMMVGKRWQEMKDTIATDLANADKLAISMVNGYLPEVYALNHNYGTYEVEKGSMVDTSYTLYDRQTVERLIKEDPSLLPSPKLDKNKDIRWNKSKFTAGITQGILQGESIPHLAHRVALGTSQSDYKAALRNARTATTGAENAGRLDSYERAEKMGIKMKKVWMATLDSRTRDSHALLDGEEQDYNKPFSNKLMYPGDISGGDPSEVWNCRCTLIADIDNSIDMSDLGWRNNKLGDMSYDDWKEAHRKREPQDNTPIINTPQNNNAPVGDMSIEPSNARKRLEASKVEHRTVTRYDSMPSEDDIINNISGGDKTKGSCASAAFAYAGNKGGMDVRDFRGGVSQWQFSHNITLDEVARLPGVGGIVVRNSNDFKAAEELLSHVVEGKQYCLGVGQHMAVVKKVGDSFQYLELQSPVVNGWKPLNRDMLKRRFGCKRSHSTYGMKYDLSAELIDIDPLAKNKEFQNLLGYLNTAADKQMKGVTGGVK